MSSNPALLDVGQAHTRHTEFAIVDVRTPGEYASGHLPGALNIPLDRIARSLPELRRAAEEKGLLLVCASGTRSQNAARTLAGHGIPATSLTGGTSSWSAHGHPLDYPAGGPRNVWAMERQVRLTSRLARPPRPAPGPAGAPGVHAAQRRHRGRPGLLRPHGHLRNGGGPRPPPVQPQPVADAALLPPGPSPGYHSESGTIPPDIRTPT